MTAVCELEDLTPGEPRTFVVDGVQVALFRMADDSVRALNATCPHKAGPLTDGQYDQKVVVCPLHQYAFSLDTGECTTPDIPAVQCFSTQVSDGKVIVGGPR
jgi:NAD(P)H-dependent nitrite reductase small subunit